MNQVSVQRRLMAILAGDMVGYSRLMELDEAGTLARLRAHRVELIDPAIGRNGGRIIKTTGDGMLVEFPSLVDAASCAIEIQQRMSRRNADVPPDRQILFRFGINIGDVIIEDGDVFGDGVNIAARVQELAEPGGICVTRAVYEQLGSRLEVAFETLGEPKLKNIKRPIPIYRLHWGQLIKPAQGEVQGEAPTVPDAASEMAGEPPSVAVLPLANMSGDPEQEFFADGLTEDIITELSRFRDILVISRNSTFVYKGKSVNIQEVAKALKVQYVVEGSVRKAGNRVRITVQLIDAETDRHIWAERYDRQLEDIFAIQDEVAASIVATLPGRLEAVAQERAIRKPTDNMAAYECVLAAKVLHHRSTLEDNDKAQVLINRAIELDPNYAHAYAWRACILGQTWVRNWCADRDATWAAIAANLETALNLDERDSDVHRVLAAVNINRGNLEAAIYHHEKGLALNPNYDLLVVQQGELLTWLGRPEEGIEWIKKAMRLNPHHPERFWNHLGRAYFVARGYREAIDAFRHISKPDHLHFAFLAACHAQLGEMDAARACASEVLARDPQFTVEGYLATLQYKLPEDADHHREALLAAGLPE
jgi:adenylate cyclase